jgi:hypothetical protein
VALAALVTAPLLLTLRLDYYLVGWETRPAWELAQIAEQIRRDGSPRVALRLLEAVADGVPSAAMTRALALARVNEFDEARATLDELTQDVQVQVVRGEVERLAGEKEQALRLWRQRDVVVANPVAWAWRRVNEPEPVADVGSEADLGVVAGVQPAESDGDRDFRWSNGAARLRLAVPTPGEYELAAVVRSYRPDGATIPVTVMIDGTPTVTEEIGADWTTITVSVQSEQTDVEVEIRSPTFVPGFRDPRMLGVMIDRVEVRGAPTRG